MEDSRPWPVDKGEGQRKKGIELVKSGRGLINPTQEVSVSSLSPGAQSYARVLIHQSPVARDLSLCA